VEFVEKSSWSSSKTLSKSSTVNIWIHVLKQTTQPLHKKILEPQVCRTGLHGTVVFLFAFLPYIVQVHVYVFLGCCCRPLKVGRRRSSSPLLGQTRSLLRPLPDLVLGRYERRARLG
jgi:hypothetical protein